MRYLYHGTYGEAKVYIDKGDGIIERNGDTITIPESDVYPIKDGEQFLAVPYSDSIRFFGGYSRLSTLGRCAIFGGMDESPFVTILNRNRFGIFQGSGEESFYESLVPRNLRSIKLLIGGEIKRQGDVFGLHSKELPQILKIATPSYLGGKDEDDSIVDNLRVFIDKKVRPVIKKNVLETRHSVMGLWCLTGVVYGRFCGESTTPDGRMFATSLEVMDGVISAPDHKNQKWTGTHLLDSMEGFFSNEIKD